MKVYKISMNQSFLICPDIRDATEELKNLEIGDKLSIEVIEMTEEEFEDIDEFDGF